MGWAGGLGGLEGQRTLDLGPRGMVRGRRVDKQLTAQCAPGAQIQAMMACYKHSGGPHQGPERSQASMLPHHQLSPKVGLASLEQPPV